MSLSKETQNKIEELRHSLTFSARIPGIDWENMLLNNFSVEVEGNTRYFQGRNIGGDVFEIKLLPVSFSPVIGTTQLGEPSRWLKNWIE